MYEELNTRLNEHIRQNAQRFAEYDKLLKGEQIMADEVKITNAGDPNAAMLMAAMGRGGGDGLFGGSGGGGLIGGLVLGSLLRNGGLGGLGGFGGEAVATQPNANMSIMSTLGDIKQAVAVSTSQMETSQALQSSTLQAQMSSIAAATVAQISSVKDAVNSNTVALMQMINGVNTNISNDGEKTRALITSQYEATLNRQLSDANAAIIELRSDQRARTSEINVTQTVSQAQAQQQQQQQFANLTNLLLDAVQNIRATNQAINIGSGLQVPTQTNSSANTRVN